MPGPKAHPIDLTEKQRSILEQVVGREKTSQQMVRRANIILLADDGENNEQISIELDLNRLTVRTWRRRWSDTAEVLATAEAEEEDKDYQKRILELLEDKARSGTPATFTAFEVCQIIALACEDPQTCDRPISHWTPRELADEVEKRGIVESISTRQVGRFLKSVRFKTTSASLLAQSRCRRPRDKKRRD